MGDLRALELGPPDILQRHPADDPRQVALVGMDSCLCLKFAIGGQLQDQEVRLALLHGGEIAVFPGGLFLRRRRRLRAFGHFSLVFNND